MAVLRLRPASSSLPPGRGVVGFGRPTASGGAPYQPPVAGGAAAPPSPTGAATAGLADARAGGLRSPLETDAAPHSKECAAARGCCSESATGLSVKLGGLPPLALGGLPLLGAGEPPGLPPPWCAQVTRAQAVFVCTCSTSV
jgi:hypothetical protein